MSVIHVLDKNIADLIAAGEVVERPCSVIKELTENSIDANAANITIEIKQGGITYIRVSDDGFGMSFEDARIAFNKHATSKILTKDDLYSIKTLGFRGEALCAIAAVSEIELITKQKNALSGIMIKLKEGNIEEEREVAHTQGTSIIVEKLFENTPARFKFLKSEAAETAVISTLVENLALSHPEISFKLIVNGKEKLYSFGKNDLKDTVYSIFGKSFSDSMIPIKFSLAYKTGELRISGFIGKPLYSKPNRNKQLFFINKRYIKSKILQIALENAYRSYMLAGRFPVCVLFIDVDYEDVDINVHPGKLEIKFADEKSIYDFVLGAVSNSLKKDKAANEYKFDEPSFNDVPNPPKDRKAEIERLIKANFEQEQKKDEIYKYEDWTIIKEEQPEKNPVINVKYDMNDEILSFNDIVSPNDNEATYLNKKIILENKQESIADNIQRNEAFKTNIDSNDEKKGLNANKNLSTNIEEQVSLTDNKSDPVVLCECFNSYAIVEYNDELWFIDKHALHERMNFENLKQNAHTETQLLLSPFVCSTDGDKYAILLERKDLLKKMGFDLEDFGDRTVLIREIPQSLPIEELENFIENFAQTLTSVKSYAESELIDKFLYDIACKASIKAGSKSSKEELISLIKNYIENESKLQYCPHGRPVKFVITKKNIEKQFKRIL